MKSRNQREGQYAGKTSGAHLRVRIYRASVGWTPPPLPGWIWCKHVLKTRRDRKAVVRFTLRNQECSA